MTFCANCGIKLDHPTAFCPNCGADLRVPIVEQLPLIESPKPTKTVRSLYLSLKNLHPKVLLKQLISDTAHWFKRKPVLKIAGLAGLLYFAVALAGLFLNSPQMLAERYVKAVQAKDFASLRDTSIFPNPLGLPVAPKFIVDGTLVSVKPFSATAEWQPLDTESEVAIVGIAETAIRRPVVAQISFWGPFIVRGWAFSDSGSTLTLKAPTSTKIDQKVQIGFKTFPSLSSGELKKHYAKEYLTIPGTFEFTTKARGLVADETTSQQVPHVGRAAIVVRPKYAMADLNARVAGLQKVESAATRCAKKNCPLVPYFSTYVLNWFPSSPIYEIFYDKKVTKDKVTSDGCDFKRVTVTDLNQGSLTYECHFTVIRTESYITYYYYLSDDVDVYAGNGSASREITVSATRLSEGSPWSIGATEY